MPATPVPPTPPDATPDRSPAGRRASAQAAAPEVDPATEQADDSGAAEEGGAPRRTRARARGRLAGAGGGLRGRLAGPSPGHVSALRIAVAALTAVVLLATTLGWVSRSRIDAAIADVAAMDAESRAGIELAEQAGDENVLVVASDPDGGERARERPDTLVMLHLPAGGERAVALSLPADLEINRPPCERWDPATATYTGQTVPAEARTTLDSVYSTGGPRCATRVVQQLTGLVVTRFAGFDLGGTAAAVDAVGGVEVCLPGPGVTVVDGGRALDLVRARATVGGPGPGRVERQHTVLAAVLGEALSLRTLLDPGRTGALADALDGTLVADGLSVDQLLALSTTLGAIEAEAVAHLPVPTRREPNVRGHTELREDAARELFEALRTDAPLPEPDVAPAATRPAPTPAEVVVDVLNATDRDGLAARVGGALAELGFAVDEVANAERPTDDTVIRFSPDREAAAGLVAAAVPSARTVLEQAGGDVLQLVLGSGFDEMVRAPATAPPPPPAGAPASCA